MHKKNLAININYRNWIK